jgi:hypothetical protein
MATPFRLRADTLQYSAWGLLAVVGWLLVGELGIAMRERWPTPIGLVVLLCLGCRARLPAPVSDVPAPRRCTSV